LTFCLKNSYNKNRKIKKRFTNLKRKEEKDEEFFKVGDYRNYSAFGTYNSSINKRIYILSRQILRRKVKMRKIISLFILYAGIVVVSIIAVLLMLFRFDQEDD